MLKDLDQVSRFFFVNTIFLYTSKTKENVNLEYLLVS